MKKHIKNRKKMYSHIPMFVSIDLNDLKVFYRSEGDFGK